ncbi:MAG: hypothetical protein OXR66_06475 [Candidatus Woesearchaeota archaeon]|nr:hypothetical protein [Candidatus Woesearchaeota archaeon]
MQKKKRFLILIVLSLLALLWISIREVKSAILVTLWIFVFLCISAAAASAFNWISRAAGKLNVACAVVILFGIVLVQTNTVQQLFPICGDGICGRGECAFCADCTPGDCKDGVCQAMERCDTSTDCLCRSDMSCVPSRGDAQGCVNVTCGDGYCDVKEGYTTCCDDCGCQQGYDCRNNVCFFLPPKITFTPYIIGEEISATTLAANPLLFNEYEQAHPFVLLMLRNSVSVARNVRVSFTAGVLEKTIAVGDLQPGVEIPVSWYLEHVPLHHNATSDEELNISVVITYTDAQDVERSPSWLYNFVLTNRNVMDNYGSLVFFVTPDDITLVDERPEAVWKSFSSLRVLPHREKVQFPVETLAVGSGTQTDLAVLLASAFYTAGVQTSLVESAYGVFVRIWHNERFVMLDPAKINGSFDDAIVVRPGYAVLDLDDVWEQRNATVLSLT